MVILFLKVLFLGIMYFIYFARFLHPRSVHKFAGKTFKDHFVTLIILLVYLLYIWGLYELIRDL